MVLRPIGSGSRCILPIIQTILQRFERDHKVSIFIFTALGSLESVMIYIGWMFQGSIHGRTKGSHLFGEKSTELAKDEDGQPILIKKGKNKGQQEKEWGYMSMNTWPQPMRYMANLNRCTQMLQQSIDTRQGLSRRLRPGCQISARQCLDSRLR